MLNYSSDIVYSDNNNSSKQNTNINFFNNYNNQFLIFIEKINKIFFSIYNNQNLENSFNDGYLVESPINKLFNNYILIFYKNANKILTNIYLSI